MKDLKGDFEIWGGLECTVNRVRERFSNQMILNGHAHRESDLDLFRELGIKKIRYPVLWETVAPESLEQFNWDWTDQRLKKLRALNVAPIATLLHHGSGPIYTSLLDDEFPNKLARYASEVAKRYPWLEYYTPVNEPLTTARFSALYGFWYPHTKDEKSFLRALINELKGTVLAMKEIRRINPAAKLIQTDDLGKCLATPPVQYQADWENERRWVTFDILLGRFDKTHAVYEYFIKNGISEEQLGWFRENKCEPEVIGINHYPLSNRFLDHRLELYPKEFHGGNGRDRYADVGAVDTGQVEPPAPLQIFREVWERYKRAFAITEVHIGGPREAQLRWLNEIYLSVKKLKSEGADVRALTAWSLLGAYDWTSLCTVDNKHYESGVFDVRTSEGPRSTAIADFITCVSRNETYQHAVLDQPGYWHLQRRVLFAPTKMKKESNVWFSLPTKKRQLVITGARGTLGRAFAKICSDRDIDYAILSRDQMDIGDVNSVRDALRALKPWAVINAAGYVRVDEAESDETRCLRENTEGPRNLAVVCTELGISLLTFSSDFVFDGSRSEPYKESSPTSPLNIYGLSKARAERAVLALNNNSLIVRTSSFFGPWDEYNFAHFTKLALKAGETVRAAHDVIISPTYVPDLVATCLDLLIDGERGLVHLTNQGEISWAQWASKTAKSLGCSDNLIQPCSILDFNLPARRPHYSALTSERMHIMPPFEDAWERYMRSLQ